MAGRAVVVWPDDPLAAIDAVHAAALAVGEADRAAFLGEVPVGEV